MKNQTPAKFNRAGNSIYINTSAEPLTLLPSETYTINAMPIGGPLYFEKITDLKCEGRMYGDIEKRADRIMNTFGTRMGSTGVMLSGEKGSGKTLLARMLSQRCRELHNMPTIMITKPVSGNALMALLSELSQPYMLFIDEFEKLYSGTKDGDGGSQADLLTLFDGASVNQRLIVITVNELGRVNDYLRNRPGRFYYHMTYHGLDEAFIRDYCDENLTDKAKADGVVGVSMMFSAFNFDMLQALVEEMNRYDEPANEVIKYLNVTPHKESLSWDITEYRCTKAYQEQWFKDMTAYTSKVKAIEKEGPITKIEVAVNKNRTWLSHSPTTDDAEIIVELKVNDVVVDARSMEFELEELVSIKNGVVTYQSEEFGLLRIKRRAIRTYHYSSLLA
jgi:hypothetical protein